MIRGKIGTRALILAIVLVVAGAITYVVPGWAPRAYLSEGPVGVANLGTGYSIAKAAVEAQCGKDIQFLEYRVGGYLPGSSDEQYSEKGFVEYTFTQGNCVPKEVGPYIPAYGVAEVIIDSKINALVGELYIHPLGGSSRKPHIDSNEIDEIKLSAPEVAQITGIPAVRLYKSNKAVLWLARSAVGAEVHEIKINAITGKIVEDRQYTQIID